MADLMRLNIDGEWTINEFAEMLQAIQQLYDFQAYCRWLSSVGQGRFLHDSLHYLMKMMDLRSKEIEYLLPFQLPLWRKTDATLEAISSTVNEVRESDIPTHLESQALVTRISYSSPGFTDIAGAGEIIGHVKDFVLNVVEMCLNREHRKQVARKLKLENDKSEIEMTQVRLEAIDRFIDIARKAGFTKTQIRSALQSVDGKVELLAGLVDQGKITSVELIDKEKADKRG